MAWTSPGGPFHSVQIGTVSAEGTITGATTGTGQPVPCHGTPYLTVYIEATDALSAGTLIIEEADFNPGVRPNAGQWSQITAVTLSTPFASAGGQVAVHLGGPGGGYAYAYVRCRIGTAVVGGTIIATLVGC